MNEQSKADFSEILKHVLDDDPILYVAVKSVLLFEERLDSVLASFLPHAEHIDLLRVSFAQKVVLARSCALNADKNPCWDLILAINKLRNDCAHSLSASARSAKLNELRRLYKTHYPSEVPADEELVWGASIHCLGFLSACVREADVVAKYHQHLKEIDARPNAYKGVAH